MAVLGAVVVLGFVDLAVPVLGVGVGEGLGVAVGMGLGVMVAESVLALNWGPGFEAPACRDDS